MSGRGILRLCLIAVSLLAGDAFFAGKPAEAKETPGKKTLCVISQVSQRFQLKKIGIMVFGNEDNTVPIENWKLDDKIYAKIRAVLAKNFNVKKIPASYEAFQPLYEPGGLFRDTAGMMKAIVQKISAGSACDYALLVAAGGSQFSNTNQYVGGLGVVETGSVLFGPARQIYALTFFYVYDGKSFEMLQYGRGESDDSTLFKPIHGPSQEIDAKQHPSLQAVTDDPKTREMVWRMIDKSIELTLPKLLGTGEALQVAKSKTKASKDNWAPF